MSNITFLIGNGFDLQIGLKTRYIDFYKMYVKDNTGDNDLITKFKKSILQDEAHGWVNWADFELGMGKASQEFESPEDFLACFDDFVKNFNDYLQEECQQIDWGKVTNTQYAEFFNSLIKFWERINSIQRERFANTVKGGNGSIGFLQFNYTDAFDRLLVKFRELLTSSIKNTGNFTNTYGITNVVSSLHIHGLLDNHPVIGVDNDHQILNEKIRQNKNVATVFVKQTFLEAIQKRNVNVPIEAQKALSVIQASNIICCFGASLGETDAYWWKQIGDWLKGDNKLLVIFDICGEEDDGKSPLSFLGRETDVDSKRHEIFNRFTKHAGWNKDDVKACGKKIIIELDCKLFNFKLPKKAHDIVS